jgi:hypothetical protein
MDIDFLLYAAVTAFVIVLGLVVGVPIRFASKIVARKYGYGIGYSWSLCSLFASITSLGVLFVLLSIDLKDDIKINLEGNGVRAGALPSDSFNKDFKGSAVLQAPSSVKQYQHFLVTLTVTPDEKESKPSTAGPSAGTIEESVQGMTLTRRMGAELVVEHDFEVAETGVRYQEVSKLEPTIWVWHVYGEYAGHKNLAVRLSTIHKIDGIETPREKIIDLTNVKVEWNTASFVMHHLEWLLTAIILPAVSWLAKKKFSSERATPAATEAS